MPPIAVPYPLLLAALVAIAALWFIWHKKDRSTNKNRRFAIIVFFVVYALIVITAAYQRISFQYELRHYDLDQNSFFTPNEITPAQQLAQANVVKDTARNFAVVTGVVIAFIVSIVFYGFLKLVTRKNQLD